MGSLVGAAHRSTDADGLARAAFLTDRPPRNRATASHDPCEWRGFPTGGAKPPSYTRDMAKAIVDPQELRRFAHDLKKFNTDLQGMTSMISNRMATLAQTWRDQEQAKFQEEFDSTIKVMQKFIKASEQHIPFLLRKAERIEEYINQR
jgi:uncharacterized protein YukE